MSSATDPRVDTYITAAAEFARPILAELRRRVHAAVPGVEETIKWRFPCFQYQGRLLCSMAAHKAHVSFGFWKPHQVLDRPPTAGAMGDFGRIRSVDDLPEPDRFAALMARAVALAAQPAPRRAGRAARPAAAAELPAVLGAALAADPALQQRFQALTPSQRREYAGWIAEAKTETTRARRLSQALEWIAQGKPRYWMYRKG